MATTPFNILRQCNGDVDETGPLLGHRNSYLNKIWLATETKWIWNFKLLLHLVNVSSVSRRIKVNEIVLSNNKSFIPYFFSHLQVPSAQASEPKPKEITSYLNTQQVQPCGEQKLWTSVLLLLTRESHLYFLQEKQYYNFRRF